ncbi:unnamed protein product [Calypogeia fissa]
MHLVVESDLEFRVAQGEWNGLREHDRVELQTEGKPNCAKRRCQHVIGTLSNRWIDLLVFRRTFYEFWSSSEEL